MKQPWIYWQTGEWDAGEQCCRKGQGSLVDGKLSMMKGLKFTLVEYINISLSPFLQPGQVPLNSSLAFLHFWSLFCSFCNVEATDRQAKFFSSLQHWSPGTRHIYNTATLLCMWVCAFVHAYTPTQMDQEMQQLKQKYCRIWRSSSCKWGPRYTLQA